MRYSLIITVVMILFITLAGCGEGRITAPSVYDSFSIEEDTKGEGVEVSLPITTRLGGIYPNPCYGVGTIYFDLANPSFVTIEIYDICNLKIKTLANSLFSPGRHNVIWNGRDENDTLVEGIYYCRMTANGYEGWSTIACLGPNTGWF